MPAPSLAMATAGLKRAAAPVPSSLPSWKGVPANVVTAPVAMTTFRMTPPNAFESVT